MKRKQSKRIVTICLMVCLLLSLFAGCRPNGETSQTDGPSDSTQPTGQNATYTITLTAATGAPMEGIGIYIYQDDTCQELVAYEKTDAKGQITFQAPELDTYVAVLQNVPAGYGVEGSYPVSAQTAIELPIQLLSGDDLSQLKLGLGDVMCDLTVTDIDGKTHTLSQLLQQKEAVVLNFWYTTCTPCRSEFPYLQEAYEQYADRIEVLALNPVDTDAEAIRAFAQELALTFPVAACDGAWQDVFALKGYPTTVIIDRHGVITLIHAGALSCTENFTDLFAAFTGDDYTHQVVENPKDLMVTEPAEDPIENPTEVSGVTSFQLTVRPGETVYCDLYRMENMYMTVKAENAYVIYKGSNYTPQNGTIGLTVNTPDTRTPVQIGICNEGDETTTYTFNLSAAYGSLNNPISLTLGQFSTTIYAGNDEGVYYRYVAQADGWLRIRCLDVTVGVPYDFVLYNMNSYANRTLEADGETDDAGMYLKIKVSAGDTVQFSASTLPNDSGSYPGAQFLFQADLMDPSQVEEEEKTEKITYAITVTDEKRQPISGVQVSVTGTVISGETTKEVSETLTTNEKGIASLELVKGEYLAVLKIPSGYSARTTELTLTEASPMSSVKFDTLEDTSKTYTVKVVDDTGAPMAGVLVLVGGESASTDAAGSVSYKLPEGVYTAVVSAPAGYQAEQTAYEFGEATEITIALVKDAGSEGPGEDEMTFTVTVVDYFGAPMANVPVTILADGTPAGVVVTNAFGIATANLAKGMYAVELPAAGYQYQADMLSEDVPEITVTAIAKVNKNDVTGLYVGDAWHVGLGATYLDGMQANVVNYVIFQPTQSGIYRITTTDPSAVVSYWGANDAYIVDQTGATDYAGNAFTREFREDQLGQAMTIIGITGSSDATLLITRISDVQLSDEEKAEWIIFQGTETPASGTIYIPTESGTLTFVDLTATTAAASPVKGDDGFYHLGSKTGPILYVELGPTGYRYVSFYSMMGNEQAGGARFSAVFYEGETFIKKEMYNDCLKAYTLAVDAEGTGVYPLNDDLIYMLKNGGRQLGWWDQNSLNYLFDAVTDLNTEIAWMFNVCYFE